MSLRYINNCVDSYGDELHMCLYAVNGDTTVGYIEYSVYMDVPRIKYIYVSPEYRRMGVGTGLLQELQRQYPDTEIDFGGTTEDGTHLIDSVTYEVVDKDLLKKVEKLKLLNSKLDFYQSELDVLYDIENPTSQEIDRIDKLGDLWQDTYESIHYLSREIDGRSPVKRFVRL